MDPFTAMAGIGAIGGLASAGVQGLVNYGLQKDAQAFNAQQAQLGRDFSAQEAQKNRDFQQYMAANGVSMKVDDLKRAGINPALAGGFSGSVATGGSAGGTAPTASSSASSISSPSLGSSAIENAIMLKHLNADRYLYDLGKIQANMMREQANIKLKHDLIVNAQQARLLK